MSIKEPLLSLAKVALLLHSIHGSHFTDSLMKVTSRKSFLVDHGGSECSGANTQHHGPAYTPGLLLGHLDPAWSTLCNHTPEIVDQGGSGGPGGPGGPGGQWSWVLDQEHCSPTLTFG